MILIEDRASGIQLIQELIEKGVSHVARYKPDGDKIMRLHAQTATIENGFVRLPREAPWLAEYLRELTLFPAGRHDDQVNSTAQALARIKSRPRAHGMAKHSRRMRRRGPGEAGGGGEAYALTRKNAQRAALLGRPGETRQASVARFGRRRLGWQIRLERDAGAARP